MSLDGAGRSTEPPPLIERESLCFSDARRGVVVHSKDEGYREELLRHYSVEESNAIERLLKFKETLRHLDSDAFFGTLTEGLAELVGAQYAFVSKRIVAEDENVAVEMPPIGEPGSCLMGIAMYISDGRDLELRLKDYKYYAYSCPCANMRHDKVFIIPEKLNDFITHNPNKVILPGEAYLGVPLFADGKCFAHFGVMWSVEGAGMRKLRWAFLELILHSLHDLVLEKAIEGRNFAGGATKTSALADRIVPHDAVAVAQSLKPYARNLSHELRTPMQGVVGMLDVMYATVQEAVEVQKDPRLRRVFQTLRENIETIQDSSRRAIEAADNVVHAYDMNMGVPDTPNSPLDPDQQAIARALGREEKGRPDIVVTGNNISINYPRSNKRRRESLDSGYGKNAKHHATEMTWGSSSLRSESFANDSCDGNLANDVSESPRTLLHPKSPSEGRADSDSDSYSPAFASENSINPGLRHANIHHVFQYVVNDLLKVGGRPDSTVARETEGGEIIEIVTRSTAGSGERVRTIEWSIAKNVPETILIDEKDFAKILSCLISNAVKFTEQGKVDISAKLSPKHRYIVISVKDTGIGIPRAFQPSLFKAFSREDDSLTRQSEGLGLGLMVARGLARKLGGDIILVQSNTEGPNHGTEFEIRAPLAPGEVCSRPGSPFGSPPPSVRRRSSADQDMPPIPSIPRPASPPRPAALTREYNSDSRLHTLPPLSSPIHVSNQSPPRSVSPSRPGPSSRRPSTRRSMEFDKKLAEKHPLTFLVAEDNQVNRKLLVSMLRKFGYKKIHEAFNGAEAVRKMEKDQINGREIDVVLMDLWMPFMDGYEAADKILSMDNGSSHNGSAGIAKRPTILAVTADATHGALERAARVGMKGFMTKPFTLPDLEKLIVEYCAHRISEKT